MRASGEERAFSRTPGHAEATGQPSARARADVLQYAAAQLLPAGSSPAALGLVLERLVSAFAAQGALVIAPGSARPVGADGAGDILDDLVLLAQVRTAWAAQGSALSAAGQPFETDLDSGQRRTGLLVVPAESAGSEPACAVALLGQTSRWKAGARATLRALATIIGTLPGPAADAAPASAITASRTASTTASTTAGPSPASAVEPGLAAADALAPALVAGAPSAIVAVDADRRIREFNPAAEELFGRRRADTLGLDMPETLVPERYRQRFVDAMAGYLATGDSSGLLPAGPAARPARRRHRAAGRAHARCRSPSAGETYFFGFLRDATELETPPRRVAEGDARFRLLSDLAPVGIVQSDADGTVPVRERQVVEMAGIPPAEVIGRNWRTTIHPDDVGKIDAHAGRTAGWPTELAADCRLLHRLRRRNVGARRGPPDHRTGRGAHRPGHRADRREHRMRMRRPQETRPAPAVGEQNAELTDLNKARLRYLATVSHELRTPLTSIVSFAELIRSEDSEPRRGRRRVPGHHPAQRRAAAAGGRRPARPQQPGRGRGPAGPAARLGAHRRQGVGPIRLGHRRGGRDQPGHRAPRTARRYRPTATGSSRSWTT